MITDFRLQVFVTVAECSSFTRAAQLLHISQPAVTKHIKELEIQLGLPLFLRHGSTISITQHGSTLLELAQRALAIYDQMDHLSTEFPLSFAGTLRLGASTTLSQYVLPILLAQFKKAYPQIQTTLINANSESIAVDLVNGSLDFGMVEDDYKHPALHYEHFQDDEIVLVTLAGPQSPKNIISHHILQTLPLVIREEGSGTLAVIDHYLKKINLSRNTMNIQMQLGSSESIKRYLTYSNCYAFISLAAVQEELLNGKFRLVNIDKLKMMRSFRFATLHGSTHRLAQLFKQYCIKQFITVRALD